MRIELTTNYKVDYRELPQGTQMRVSNKKGKGLIEMGVAVEINGLTKEEQIDQDIEYGINEIETAEVAPEPEKKKKPSSKRPKKSK